MDNVKIYLKSNFRIFAIDNLSIINDFFNLNKPNIVNALVYANMLNSFSVLHFSFSDENFKISYLLRSNGLVNNALIEIQNNTIRTLINNNLNIDKNDFNKNLNELDFEKIIGTNGSLKINKNINGKNFTSETELKYKTLEENICFFLSQSEQIFSATKSILEFDQNNYLNVKRAQFILFQKLPQAKEEDIVFFENFLKKNSLKNQTIEEFFDKLKDAKLIATNKVSFGCFCSREKMLNALKSIDENSLENLLKTQSKIETICQFCKKNFLFTKKDLK